ncbi:ATP-dependent endonuclease [Mycetocola sp. 2940]|uniref:ATP-dependent endonuclease n=1 Tax=Mycetocola sp. 2940 TaxID=3156452 RepID=UPI003397BDAF
MEDMARFRAAVSAWVTRDKDVSVPAEVGELADSVRRAVLVEGDSDRVAIEALAEARGRDFERERVAIIPLGGAMNIRNYVGLLGPNGLGLALAGLCDVGEEGYFRRALHDAGLGHDLSRAALEDLGFSVCDADLEDELIRSLGVDAVERVLDAQGDLRAFRTFQNQPAQRTRAVDAQLRRFLGTIGGRKSRYARALVEALGTTPAPRPLELVLDATAT